MIDTPGHTFPGLGTDTEQAVNPVGNGGEHDGGWHEADSTINNHKSTIKHHLPIFQASSVSANSRPSAA